MSQEHTDYPTNMPYDPQAQGQAATKAVETRRKQRSRARELIETLVLTALIFFAVRGVVQSFRVEGESMLPSLQSEELLMVNKAVYWHTDEDSPLAFLAQTDFGGSERFVLHPPQHGDVIVFHAPRDPGKDYIKRVIGVPGDFIEIREGRVWRNGQQLHEPYLDAANRAESGYPGQREQWTVPTDNLFVLGDNRLGSSDSRTWGFVPYDNVVGKAVFTYWPVGELGAVPGSLLPPLLGRLAR
ncbi:MAG: signal peptidase I [Chloroflexota bacterium]|nr:signal peptidase I [Chloroflexota bacterium]